MKRTFLRRLVIGCVAAVALMVLMVPIAKLAPNFSLSKLRDKLKFVGHSH